MEEQDTQTDEGALSKEEILSRSRKENMLNGDERECSRMRWMRNFAGFSVMVLACTIVMLVRVFTEDVLPYEIMAILFTGLLAQNSVDIFVITNKKLKVLSIVAEVVFVVVTILYWVEWGLFLGGK